MGMLRLFAAVPLPADLTAKLSAPLALARAQAPGIKWIDPAGMHITLKFFGDTPEERVGRLIQLLAEAASGVAPFEITVKGIGAFPAASRPRVVWAGVAGGSRELSTLAARVHIATEEEGFGEPGGAGFLPHITIGRVRRDVRDAAIPPAFATESEREWGKAAVSVIILYSSLLKPAGPVYRQLAQAPLRP